MSDELKTCQEALLQAQAELARYHENLERFLHEITHDLRSPLVTSAGFLGILKDDLAANKHDSVADYISRIESANKRMQVLIEELVERAKTQLKKAD